jgi:hypothetical protein
MKVLTRTLTAKQAVAETFQRVIEHMTSDALRANKTPRINIAAPEVGEAPPPPNFNEAVRAAHRRADDDDFVAAEVNGVPAPPSLNSSVVKFLKGFKR